MKDSPFFKQADLLVQMLPFVNAETCFALKGGTAINFFVRNFPRLSVDIDLVYVPARTVRLHFGELTAHSNASQQRSAAQCQRPKSRNESSPLRTVW
jgi:hypothetical protein